MTHLPLDHSNPNSEGSEEDLAALFINQIGNLADLIIPRTSRLHPIQPGVSDETEIAENYRLLKLNGLDQRIKKSYDGDSVVTSLALLIRNRRFPTNWKLRVDLLWTEGRAYIGSNQALRNDLIYAAHIHPETNYHYTVQTTREHLDYVCYWPDVEEDVQTYINRCGCQPSLSPSDIPLISPPNRPIRQATPIPPVPPIPAQYQTNGIQTTD